MLRILVMRPDQPNELIHLKLPTEPSYRQLSNVIRPLLDGGDFEHVNVLADFEGGLNFRPADMFVDEIGAPAGGKNLPRNEAATLIYRRATMLGRSAAPKPADPETLSAIYGPAIRFERKVWT